MTRAQNAPPQSSLLADDVSEDGRAIRLGSPLDLIDSGADDNEPVEQVTHGHLRQWHDMFAEMQALIEKLASECQAWAVENDELRNRLNGRRNMPNPAQRKTAE